MTTFTQIMAYIMSAALLGLAFWLVKKDRHKLAALAILLSFFSFFMAQLSANGIFIFQDKLTKEQVFCWLFALAYLGLAIFFAKKDSLAYAFIILIFSVGCCFCGLSGVQALLKTHMLQQVTSSLNSYGEKIDKYQTSVSEMRDGLAKEQSLLTERVEKYQNTVSNLDKNITQEQSKLAANELSLSNQQGGFKVEINQDNIALSKQFQNLSNLFIGIKIANQNDQDAIRVQIAKSTMLQSNLDETATKLSDVQYLVQNLYAKTVTETYSVQDTNNFMLASSTTNGISYIVRLNHVPIAGSVEESTTTAMGFEERKYVNNIVLNITVVEFQSGWDTNAVNVTMHYVIDDRTTSFYTNMPELNKQIWLKGHGFTLNKLDK